MKVIVVTSRSSPYTEFAKSIMIRLAREEGLEYEIYEVDEGEVPVSVKGRELPCFLVDEKVVWEGRPSYEGIRKAISQKKPRLGKRILDMIWGKK